MTFADDCLAGRLVLVTGASSGLGQATALSLSRCGARLALAARNSDRLQQTLDSLEGEGHSMHAVDFTDAEASASAIQAIAAEHGSFSGIFHSAGTTVVLPARLLKNRHLDDVFGAGVRGAFGIAKAAGKRGVLLDGGSIVIMSSAAATRGRPALSAYCAAKAAVDGLVRAVALELADRKIRINSIQAAAVETAMHHEFMASISEEAGRDYEQRHPLGFGQPDDVANAVLFLLSDASKWITGTSFPVDGGAAAK